jgi:protein TonB
MAAHPALIPSYGMPVQRMLIALGASLLVHVLLVGGWGSGAARTTPVAPLQARLEPAPAALPQPALVDAPAAMAMSRSVSRRATPAPAVAAAPAAASAAVAGPDLRFYLARELDQYPSPLSPLRLDAGSVRLWVSIDQAGRVLDAAVIDADPPGEMERQARGRVLATSFVPARRDGQAVKSRVLLVLGQGS